LGDLDESHRPVPEWMDTMAQHMPPMMWHHAAEKIEKVRKKQEDEMKKADKED
jgi:hypothetical protein